MIFSCFITFPFNQRIFSCRTKWSKSPQHKQTDFWSANVLDRREHLLLVQSVVQKFWTIRQQAVILLFIIANHLPNWTKSIIIYIYIYKRMSICDWDNRIGMTGNYHHFINRIGKQISNKTLCRPLLLLFVVSLFSEKQPILVVPMFSHQWDIFIQQLTKRNVKMITYT